MLLQTLVTGFSVGSIYALIAVGYSFVFSVLGFSNFAHGMIITLGAYIAFFLMRLWGVPFLPALAVAIVGTAILSFINERVAYSTLRRRKAPSLYLMISAMGVSIFLENLIYCTIGPKLYGFPPIFRGTISIGTVSISQLDLSAFLFSTVTIIVLHLLVKYTKLGIAIRGASYDMEIVSMLGVHLDKLIAMIFLIAGGTGGLAGVFLGIRYMVYPTMGIITNKAYIGAVIGGLGSLPGAIIGGILLGIVETIVSVYISSIMRDVFSFGILIILLLFLPYGLVGRPAEEKP